MIMIPRERTALLLAIICLLYYSLQVLSISDGSSDTSQHQRSADDLSEEDRSPAGEKTPKKEIASSQIDAAEQNSDAVKTLYNSRSDDQLTLKESPTNSEGDNQHTIRGEGDIPASNDGNSVKKQVLRSIRSSRELSGYVRDESKEPAQDVFVEGAALVAQMDRYSKSKGYKVLQISASQGNTKAKELLAYGSIFGVGRPRNFTYAFEAFSELAELGIPAGQHGLGFMYSTGLGISSNQAKALLHYVFAALGGHPYAQLAMGYRSMMGIGVVQSCESALSYYYKAAKKVVSDSSLITGGHAISKVRLMDEENEAENVVGVSENDMINYHSVFADSGNSGAQLLLGMFYMYGMAGAERNFEMALRFLQQASDNGYPAASVLIGKIFTEGSDEVPKDYVKAMQHFEMAADQNHGDGYSGLGMMYLNGYGVEKSYTVALQYFQKAVDRGSAEGQYYLGYMFQNGYGTNKDKARALSYFQLAAHGGHLHAIFNLGEMNADGKVVKRNCNFAVELFKSVSERGKWSYMFMEAMQLYDDGDTESSLMMYTFLAELGMEVAQSNAAFLLEQDDITLVSKDEALKRALTYWNRAAAQGYVEARVKLGDYYYYGCGTEVNYEASASQYRIASDKQASPQAMFNLGYMYEQGLGLEKDYHLAKRYYDMAAETSAEAMVPVNLAILKMNILMLYNTYEVFRLEILYEKAELVFGEMWDIYLITVMSGLVLLIIMWRRHRR